MRFLAAASLLLIAAAPQHPGSRPRRRGGVEQRAAMPDPNQHYAVRYAVDGDTIDVSGIGRVRLLGVDAPEIGAGFDTPAPFAREARNFMASEVVGRFVRLELDAESHDGYGRLLAYVIRDDDVDVNAELLRAGLARISARYPLRRLSELQAAESDAQSARRGMWADAPAVSNTTTYRLPGPRSSQTRKPRNKKGTEKYRVRAP